MITKNAFLHLSVLLVLCLSQVGCASFGRKFKAFLNGTEVSEPKVASQDLGPTYSDNPNFLNSPRRQYKRVTKQSFEEQAQLGEKSGSLWTMEGQGAYLFSQNIVRMIGDPIGIKIDGEPKEQLGTKVGVIRNLLAKLEERQKARLRKPASEDGEEEPKEGDVAAKEKGQITNGNTPPKTAEAAPELPSDFNVKTVPTRIVERMIDGNYRVKGSQPLMIGPREYKVIVTGIVRAEDFNEEGLSATQLLDPKFDIVSVRRKDSDI